VLTDGPHAYWRGSIPVPPTIDLQLADQTGRGNYLRLYHASPAQDTYPKDAPSLIASDSANPAMDFIPDSNAWRDSGSQGPDFSPTTAMSLELWCKPRAGALSGLVQHDLARKAGYYGLIIEYQAGNYVFAGLAADGTNSVTRWVYSPSPSRGWHHVPRRPHPRHHQPAALRQRHARRHAAARGHLHSWRAS
jgi:hypothetical protein